MPHSNHPVSFPRNSFSKMSHPVSRGVMIGAIMALAYFSWLPFPWRMPVVGLMGIALVWLETQDWRACGLTWRGLGPTLGWTALLVLFVTAIIT
ncbi:CAAX protease, partial [Xanthomonas citri pv. citri]